MEILDLTTHPKKFVTIDEYADFLELSPRTIYHNIEKGALFAVKVGGSIKIPIEEARRFASVPARSV